MGLVHGQNIFWLNAQNAPRICSHFPGPFMDLSFIDGAQLENQEKLLSKRRRHHDCTQTTTRKSIHFASLYAVAVPTDGQAD